MKRKKRPVSNYIEQETVLNKAWLSTEDLLIIIPAGMNAVDNFRKSICEEMDKNGEFYFKTRPILIPTKKVIEKAHIDVALIRREANKMRKAMMWMKKDIKAIIQFYLVLILGVIFLVNC